MKLKEADCAACCLGLTLRHIEGAFGGRLGHAEGSTTRRAATTGRMDDVLSGSPDLATELVNSTSPDSLNKCAIFRVAAFRETY